MVGCSVDGQLNEAKFSEPIPWIGLYVAAASLACAIAMAKDLLRSFRQKKLWFPSKYFSINATSLTITTVATKLSVDLNTPMPRRIDQLAKLSSGALICTVMGNSMPSLGSMDNSDLLTNMVALGILVVTAIVNVGMQLGTGVIYIYWREHAFIMFFMLVLLVILSFSAITVPTTKKFLEYEYKKKTGMAKKECSKGDVSRENQNLKEDLSKYWMMAHTSCSQFVMGRSATCTASGAICLLSAMTFGEAMLRSYLMPSAFRFCSGESDYKWSTILILIAQTIAVGVGTIAPAIRWFTAVNFRCPGRGKKETGKGYFLKVERYWIKLLLELKEHPFTMGIKYKCCRKLVHETTHLVLDMLIVMQSGIVLGCKVIQCISVYFVSRMLFFSDWCKNWKLFRPDNIISIDPGSESQPSSKLDLSRFVLHLEGEDELVELMMKNNFDATDHWLCRGRRKEPKYLPQFLEKSRFCEGFRGVEEFDSDLVPSLTCEEPPNCWGLPVVTLTAIAVALPNVSDCLLQQIMHTVHEGLKYVKIVEDNLCDKDALKKIQKAAYLVWLEIDLYQKWLEVDLRNLSLQAGTAKEVLEGLGEAAKKTLLEYKESSCVDQCINDNPFKWPIKVLAANSMYRISQTMLQQHHLNVNHQTGEKLFEAIKVMISDIMGACLTNLQPVLLRSLSSSWEEREESIRFAVYLLGRTEKILKVADRSSFSSLAEDQIAYIDEWRSFHRMKSLSLEKNEEDSAAPNDLYLTVE
ncbi:hypothetical protein Tsubulata_036336 [Turnera subulata]|uniref:Uncharacterized protein n=1 Tax=Turnera subulata TaxID=218843 RepID=A0A9Q0FLJ2_9ROSI|nr:hypothetical protein Tsubulata_036336 [Turnera subulata]